MIILTIKLDDGTKIRKKMTDEDIKQAESNKYFKKITRQNNNDFKKYQKETYHSFTIKDEKKIEQRFQDLIGYIDFLKTL